MTSGPLGILAGGGPLPGRVAAAARSKGRDVFIIAFEDFAEPAVIGAYPHATVRLGAAGRMFKLLRDNNCRELCLIGPVRRPSLLDLRPDAEGARLVARIGRAAFTGDDGLLAAIVRVLAEEGFSIIGAHEILTEAVGRPGPLGRHAPDEQAQADIARGIAVIRALGAVDVGQACVVQQGCVLAVEAIEGTDAMLARAATLLRPVPGGVLIKMVKPGQDRRADLPTIGPRTITAAKAAGLRGIAFEAGGTLLTDTHACIAEADKAGLFLLGINPDLAKEKTWGAVPAPPDPPSLPGGST
jgi:DUF1009 family protein